MGIYRSIAGTLTVEIVSADIAAFVSSLSAENILVLSLKSIDEITASICIYRQDYRRLKELGQRRGECLRLKRRSGLYWRIKRFVKRPFLVVPMFLLILLVLFLPSRVLFVRVEGNTSIPDKQILEQAQLCGIQFGASRREVRSEKMKNNLIACIPDLQWAGINTYGCVAVISVEERTVADPPSTYKGVSSIVAARDGIIASCVVTKGNALCRNGQAVKEGEVLVSGYTDLGISIRATAAEAEIYAETKRNLTVVHPLIYNKKGSISNEEQKISLCIGKKRINFYKGSGISNTSCDKMYAEYYLTLPGGFQLPVAIVVEKFMYYDTEAIHTAVETGESLLTRFAETYLHEQMVSGQIVSQNVAFENDDGGVCLLNGEYTCIEMIGRTKIEEIIEDYGKNN